MRIFLLLFGAATFGLVIWHYAEASELEKFQVFLVGAPITISFFAINFSLSTFQNSEFRSLYSSVSPRLTTGAFICFLIGIIPVVSLAFQPTLSGKIGLTLIPVAFVSSFVLYLVARSETNPLRLIRRATKPRKWKRFLRDYWVAFQALERNPACAKLVDSRDKPTHEWDWKLSPQLEATNPGEVVSGIGDLALSARDQNAFLAGVKALVESDEAVIAAKPKERQPYDLRPFYIEPLRELFLRAENEPSEKLTESAIDLVACRVLELVKKPAPNYRTIVDPLGLLYRTSLHWMEKGETGPARKSLVLFRQLWQHGLDRAAADKDEDSEGNDDGIECFFFWHNLNHMARLIEGLGSKAIKLNDPGFLHLVHEGFGFQGCSAVKQDALPVGEECIRALAQLGREARAAKLECHWEKCAALPHDHAIERINWIWSWIAKIEEDDVAELWVDSCLAGISRIEGKVIEVIDRGHGKKPRWELKRTDEPYTESFSGLDGSRVLDYSDSEMLKSFTLIGAGRSLIQGPPVSIKFEDQTD
ncbi:MAG: hypothetical protein P1U85_01640 [Verrucomicrobiales bacterium]|nr:hypothetical protein [Verrucomicrobiales bacterium]